MDVVLCPIGSEEDSWSLTDRLGRHLGQIQKSTGIEIRPVAGTALQGVATHHASLDGAMTAIAKHMSGACDLDSRDWD